MKIHPKDIVLLECFLEREANDFPEGTYERRAIADNITLAIAAFRYSHPQFLHVRSHSNLGIRSRQLTLTPVGAKLFSSYDVVVDLCPCGRANHWGAIRREAH